VSDGRPDWATVRDRLRARGLRWTPQRRTLIEVLSRSDGHVTGSELVERCRQLDASTIPSTVYRTLDVLEQLGLVRHGHGADGREEFHVLPEAVHGHLHCGVCGDTHEIDADDAAAFVSGIESRYGFAVDLSHVTVVGVCGACRDASDGAGDRSGAAESGGLGDPFGTRAPDEPGAGTNPSR
jgi:Fur family transcriptional regulator, ferric uptake regulator